MPTKKEGRDVRLLAYNLPYLQHQFSFVIIITCVPLIDNSVTVSKKKYGNK